MQKNYRRSLTRKQRRQRERNWKKAAASQVRMEKRLPMTLLNIQQMRRRIPVAMR